MPERLALNSSTGSSPLATLDGLEPVDLKHLLLKEHRRIQRAAGLEAAECARERNVSAGAVLWDSKGRWRAQRPSSAAARVEAEAVPLRPVSAPRTCATQSRRSLSSIPSPRLAWTGKDDDEEVVKKRLINIQAIELGSANDERLGHMRGLLELMARKKMRALELQEAAEQTKTSLDGMRRDVARLLSTHDTLAGGARVKEGKLTADKRKLRQCEAMRRDSLNMLSCCRSTSQVQPIPEGWRWSHSRAICHACRATLHKLQIQHSATEILARTVTAEERQLAVTQKELKNMGSTVSRLLDTAFYRPITLTTQSAIEECAHGIVFTVAATEHPVVVTGILCARHPWSHTVQQMMTVRVSPIHTEEPGWKVAQDLPSWTLAGYSAAMPASYTSCLPSVSVFDSEPCYGHVPLKQPFVVEVGTQRSVAVHSDDRHGILNRHERSLSVGQCSDSANCLQVKVGLVLGPNLEARLNRNTKTACFVGQIVYRRVPVI